MENENTESANNESANNESAADSSVVAVQPAAAAPVAVDFGKAFSESLEVFKKNAPFLIGATLVAGLAGCLCFILMPIVFVGYYSIALRLIDGDRTPPAVGDVFAKFNFFLPAFVAILLGGLGALACGIGALITGPVMTLALFRMYDKGDTSACGAFCEIFKRVIHGGWMLLVWVIVANLIGQLGAMVCYVGLFATLPLGALITAHVYRQAFPK